VIKCRAGISESQEEFLGEYRAILGLDNFGKSCYVSGHRTRRFSRKIGNQVRQKRSDKIDELI